MTEASAVPTEITAAVYLAIAALVAGVGKMLIDLVNKWGALQSAKIDALIFRVQHNTEHLDRLHDCLDSTDAQYIIDYRLFEHGLIAEPTRHDREKASEEDGEPEQQGPGAGEPERDGKDGA